jgi:pantoate--beta-alanine ligase
MQVLHTIAEMRQASRAARKSGQRLGFVPTMGALHEGHLSLVREARKQCEAVAASIFVNPTQFGPNEDYNKYPRTLERDSEMLRKESLDFVFAPAAEEMYPAGAVTWVTVEDLSERLCGRSRPGHFRGVTTVVNKLFNIVEPDLAFFGQKDAAQVAILKRMVRDLRMGVEIVVCPIVREVDGLAMSSRNAYLSASERRAALILSRTLQEVERCFDAGERGTATLTADGKRVFGMEPSARLDYLEIVDPETLQTLGTVDRPALVAIAAFVGSTRLIDNVVLKI